MGRRLCESEREYRKLEHDGTLKGAIGAYAIGRRSSDILFTLAVARVWSDNIGEWVPCPVGYDRTTWHDILDKLVLEHVGDRRCLDCGNFYRSSHSSFCEVCGSQFGDPIACVEGVV